MCAADTTMIPCIPFASHVASVLCAAFLVIWFSSLLLGFAVRCRWLLVGIHQLVSPEGRLTCHARLFYHMSVTNGQRPSHQRVVEGEGLLLQLLLRCFPSTAIQCGHAHAGVL
jgi:hypothetical protein